MAIIIIKPVLITMLAVVLAIPTTLSANTVDTGAQHHSIQRVQRWAAVAVPILWSLWEHRVSG